MTNTATAVEQSPPLPEALRLADLMDNTRSIGTVNGLPVAMAISIELRLQHAALAAKDAEIASILSQLAAAKEREAKLRAALHILTNALEQPFQVQMTQKQLAVIGRAALTQPEGEQK